MTPVTKERFLPGLDDDADFMRTEQVERVLEFFLEALKAGRKQSVELSLIRKGRPRNEAREELVWHVAETLEKAGHALTTTRAEKRDDGTIKGGGLFVAVLELILQSAGEQVSDAQPMARKYLSRRKKAQISAQPSKSPAEDRLDSIERDVISALLNLGYPKDKAETVVSRVMREGETDRFEMLLLKSLRGLAG